jgi:hypothetical protein
MTRKEWNEFATPPVSAKYAPMGRVRNHILNCATTPDSACSPVASIPTGRMTTEGHTGATIGSGCPIPRTENGRCITAARRM